MQWRSGYAEGVTKYQMNARQTSPARSSAPYPAQILPHCSTEFGLFSADCSEDIASSSIASVIFFLPRTLSYGGGTHGQGKQHFPAGDPSSDHIQEKNDEGL
jgi:hypothetical protein